MRLCQCDCSKLSPFTSEEAREVLRFMFYQKTSPSEAASLPPQLEGHELWDALAEGMTHELEHCDITGGEPVMTARIALAHLKENIHYYERLKELGL